MRHVKFQWCQFKNRASVSNSDIQDIILGSLSNDFNSVEQFGLKVSAVLSFVVGVVVVGVVVVECVPLRVCCC